MRFLISGAIVLAFVAGVGADAAASSEVEALRARVEAYWQARVEHAPDLSEFSVPKDKGGSGPRRQTKRPNVEIEGATIETIEITDDVGSVEVLLHIGAYRFRMSPQMAAALRQNELARTKRLRQEWVRVDGEWYRGKKLLLNGFFKALSQQQNRPAPVAEVGKGSSGVVTGGDGSVRSAEN